MKIVKAVPSDLVEVLFLLKECVSDFNLSGLKHWNNAYPGAGAMKEAIDNGALYLYKEIGITKGMFVLSEEEPKEYKDVEWKTNSDRVLFVKYLAVHPGWKDKGIQARLIDYIEHYAGNNNFASIRVDVYGGIESAENFGQEIGFDKAGQFQTSFQTTPYLAFEKGL